MAVQRALSRSTRLLRARRFAEVISLLEPQVFLYRESFTFYYNLGVACLYVGDFGGAFSYLQRAQQLDPSSIPVLLALAAVHLRRRQTTEALRYWLEVLDHDPRNPVAKRGLALVRTNEDPSVYVTMAESGKLRRYYPSLGFALPRWTYLVAAVALLAVAGVLAGPRIVAVIPQGERPQREGAQTIAIQEQDSDLTDYSGEFRYVLTNEEIQDALDRIGQLFNEFRDNLAHRETNRLLNSNASDLVKERLRLLSSYFREPTFVNFSDNFSYTDVAAEPWLYDGCYVRWSGQTSNITTGSDAIRFTLLVGYEDERVLEGTIPVTIPFAADVQPGPVELIGRLSYDEEHLSLTATGIRRLAPTGGR